MSNEAEPEFTKGPWRFSRYYDFRKKDYVPGRYQNISLPIPGRALGSRGIVLGVGIKGNVDDYWISLNDADARLIASAPDLFEALRECEEFFDERADADQPAGCDSPIPNEEMKVLLKVRAALLKATQGDENV